jgi:hypothetical protein
MKKETISENQLKQLLIQASNLLSKASDISNKLQTVEIEKASRKEKGSLDLGMLIMVTRNVDDALKCTQSAIKWTRYLRRK